MVRAWSAEPTPRGRTVGEGIFGNPAVLVALILPGYVFLQVRRWLPSKWGGQGSPSGENREIPLLGTVVASILVGLAIYWVMALFADDLSWLVGCSNGRTSACLAARQAYIAPLSEVILRDRPAIAPHAVPANVALRLRMLFLGSVALPALASLFYSFLLELPGEVRRCPIWKCLGNVLSKLRRRVLGSWPWPKLKTFRDWVLNRLHWPKLKSWLSRACAGDVSATTATETKTPEDPQHASGDPQDQPPPPDAKPLCNSSPNCS